MKDIVNNKIYAIKKNFYFYLISFVGIKQIKINKYFFKKIKINNKIINNYKYKRIFLYKIKKKLKIF